MTKSVEEEPTVTLKHWHLVYHDDIGYRLVGIRQEGARISSPVVDLDVDGGRAVTESGRVYELVGEPNSAVAERIIRRWHKRTMQLTGDMHLVDPSEFEERPRRGLH